MKILKYIFFALVGLVILFAFIGLLKPSVSYGAEIKVNKPVEEAWAVTQDASKYEQWLEGFKSIELIGGEEGAVGSKYKVVVDPGNEEPEFEMVETVVSLEEFEHVKMHFESDFMDFDQTILFDEHNGITTVKTDSKVMGKSVMSRAMFALMEMLAGSFTEQESKNMKALKTLIEKNTKDYYPEAEVIKSEAAL